jgi:hypothetical protein
LDKTADPFGAYPHGISEGSAQGKAFIDLMRSYENVIWFHGHTHNTFEADDYAVATATARGYKSVNIPSLQGPRKFGEDGSFTTLISEGYVVDVYEDYIILKALDFNPVNQDGTGTPRLIEQYVLDTTIAQPVIEEEDLMISITVAFAQGDIVIYNIDTLDVLKSMLTVTANYESGATETVTSYTLSGTLSTGTSAITVTYQGLTTTFNVNVTEYVPPAYTNLVPTSVDTSGNIYNTTGYKQNYRLGSSGTESAYNGAIICGFIPIQSLSDVIRITGHPSSTAMVSGYNRAILYNSSFAKVGVYDLQSARAGVELSVNEKFGTHEIKLVMNEHTGIADPSSAVYFRVTVGVCNDPNAFIITRNEEIA